MGKKKNTAELLNELRQYDASGLSLYLNGNPSTPKAIVKAHKVAESGTYMRDYIEDDKGEVNKLSFDLIEKI
jgi:hypothetical protein